MLCNNCNKVIDDDSVYCKYCGLKVEQESAKDMIAEEAAQNENVEVVYVGSEEVMGSIKFLDYLILKGYYYCETTDCYYVPICYRSNDPCCDVWVGFWPKSTENRLLGEDIDTEKKCRFCLYQVRGDKFREEQLSKEMIVVNDDLFGRHEYHLIINFEFDSSNTRSFSELEDLEREIINRFRERNEEDCKDDFWWDFEYLGDRYFDYDDIEIDWRMPNGKIFNTRNVR